MESKLSRLASGRWYDVDIVIAIAIGGERDPLAVGRKAWEDIARFVVGEAFGRAAVIVCNPDVSEIAEGNFAFVVGRMTKQAYVSMGESGKQQSSARKESSSDHL